MEHLLALLARHGKAGIPASVTKALKRWEQAGTEARTETQVVLRVKRPEIIKELQKIARRAIPGPGAGRRQPSRSNPARRTR